MLGFKYGNKTLTIKLELKMTDLTQAGADAIGEALQAAATDIAAKLSALPKPIDDTKIQAGLAAVQALDIQVAPTV